MNVTEYTFEGSLFVEGPATLDEIKTWLKDAVSLDIDYKQHGQISERCDFSSMLLIWSSLELVEPPSETPWIKNEVPDKAGKYWYYGPRFRDNPPEMYLCTIRVVQGGLMIVIEGNFWYRAELAEGVDFWFAPANPPKLPK